MFLRPWNNLSFFGGYTLFQRIQTTKSCVTLELANHPIAVGVEYHRTFGRWRFGAALSGTLELTTHATKNSCPEIAAHPRKTAANWAISPGIYGGLELFNRVELFVQANVAFHIGQRRYKVELALQTEQVLLETRPIQPVGWLGPAIDIF